MTEPISNKETMDRLQKYLEKQDMKVVCKVCASLMIDMNRVFSIHGLSNDEVEHLWERIRMNSFELEKFLKDGPSGNLTPIITRDENYEYK